MDANILSIRAGETWRGAGLVLKSSGSPIVSGTVNYYLKCLYGANAGKWWKDSDQTWAVTETANVMMHQVDGGWTIELLASPFTAEEIYYEYAKENENLHIAAEGKFLRGSLDANSFSIQVGETWRGYGLVLRESGGPIISGDIKHYLKCLNGVYAGKWWKNDDQTWVVTETGTTMEHQADGGWAVELSVSPFSAEEIYYDYVKESNNLHVAAEGKLLRGQAVIVAKWPPVNKVIRGTTYGPVTGFEFLGVAPDTLVNPPEIPAFIRQYGNLYSLLRRNGKDVTIVRRIVTGIDRLTGEKIITEQRWRGVAGFIPYRALPRKDQVVVADAWFITDQVIQDKDEFHCMGDTYVAVGISQFDHYCVVATKMATMGETDMSFRSDHEQSDALSGQLN